MAILAITPAFEVSFRVRLAAADDPPTRSGSTGADWEAMAMASQLVERLIDVLTFAGKSP